MLEDDAEAFQNKLEDMHVRDVTKENPRSRYNHEREAKRYQEAMQGIYVSITSSAASELAPIEEEQRPYELLLSSFGGVKQATALVKKRKLENAPATVPTEPPEKKRKSEKTALKQVEPEETEEKKDEEKKESKEEDFEIKDETVCRNVF